MAKDNIEIFCGGDQHVTRFNEGIRAVCEESTGCTYAAMVGVLEIVKRDLIEEMIEDHYDRES